MQVLNSMFLRLSARIVLKGKMWPTNSRATKEALKCFSTPFAEKTIAKFKLQNRIDFKDVDYLEQDIKGIYDVVWLSHILHGEGPEDCRNIIGKAVSSLEPGGMILIHDFILNDSMDGPLFPALFSLNMLLVTPSGPSYSEKQIRDMLSDAGVREIRRIFFELPNDSGIITGIV